MRTTLLYAGHVDLLVMQCSPTVDEQIVGERIKSGTNIIIGLFMLLV